MNTSLILGLTLAGLAALIVAIAAFRARRRAPDGRTRRGGVDPGGWYVAGIGGDSGGHGGHGSDGGGSGGDGGGASGGDAGSH